jgi:hypothetical protein
MAGRFLMAVDFAQLPLPPTVWSEGTNLLKESAFVPPVSLLFWVLLGGFQEWGWGVPPPPYPHKILGS